MGEHNPQPDLDPLIQSLLTLLGGVPALLLVGFLAGLRTLSTYALAELLRDPEVKRALQGSLASLLGDASLRYSLKSLVLDLLRDEDVRREIAAIVREASK